MRVLLFTGKGGAGTTTTAAATAVHAARSGRSTLLLSADAALADVLDAPLTPGAAREILPGLRAEHLDTATRVEGSWDLLPPAVARLLGALDVDAAEAGALAGLPGADDLATLLTLRDRVRAGQAAGTGPAGRTDVVVLDCPASPQTLRMLALPELLGRLVDRLLPVSHRVVRQVVGQVVRGLGAVGAACDPAAESVRALLRLRTDLADLRDVLHAPDTSVRLVLTPEIVALADARRTLSLLALHGCAVDAAVANRVVPDGADHWRASRAGAQRAVLDKAREAFAPLPLLTAPFLDHEPVGAQALAVLGEQLYEGAHPTGALAGRDLPAPVRVEPDGEDFELVLDLGLAPGQPPRLSRLEDDLVIAVPGGRRVLPLPPVLRRCVVSGARVRQGAVRVRFERHPDLWPAT